MKFYTLYYPLRKKRGIIFKTILVMKLTILLITVVCLHVTAATYAQKVTLNEKDAPLDKVFNDIKKQSGYIFFYNNNVLNGTSKVNINVKDATLQDALDQVLKDQPLEYTIVDNTIVVKKKEETFLDNLKNKIKAELVQATVAGKVVDGTGQPLPGVNVKEKGTQNGTITDNKGAFNLTVTSMDAIISFSFIGYETKELTPKDLPKGVVIILKAAENNLREVVINKGYYDEKAALSTGDVSVVSSNEIEEQPVGDPILTLEAKVPGLYIQQSSGIPGTNFTVLLRGVNSIANGNSPLFIIDGVPFSSNSLSPGFGSGALGNGTNAGFLGGASGISPFNALNPDDIESITILKDADALAIYGSKGANGVILITTKKGHAGNTTVNFDISQGDAKVAHFMDLMNTQQYLQMRHKAFALDGTTSGSTDYDVNGTWDTTRYTNWQKTLIGGTAQNTNAQLSLSSGSENTQFYIGGGFRRQTTVFPGDFSDEKSSLNFSLTHSSADKRFQLQFSGGYVHDNDYVPITDLTSLALTLAPDAPALYKPDGSLNWEIVNGTYTWTNPIGFNVFETAVAVTNNLTSHMDLSYRILTGVTLGAGLGYGDDELQQTNILPSIKAYPPPYNTGQFSSNTFGNTALTNWIIEPKITYDRKIAAGKLNVVVGASFQRNNSVGDAFKATGFTSDALIANPSNATNFQFEGLTDAQYRYNAGYARIGYTWEDKYLLNITANRDGSSRFGPGNQWGNFGSVGAGWIFTKEKLIGNQFSWLSFGKLRASYGITGNDQIGDYGYLDSYSTISNTYLGTTGLQPTRIANPNYGWEVDRKLEGAIELGFLQDRINFTASYYRNRTGNQLVGYTLPNISGFTTVEENLPAVVQNTGLEMTLRSVNFQSGTFKWITSFNLTIPENKLVAYPGLSSSGYANVYVVGQSLFIRKRYNYADVNPADGVYQVLSAAGVPTESPTYPNDLINSPPITQKWYGGLTNSFTYKGFRLDFTLQIVKQTALNYWNIGALDNAGSFNYNEPVMLIGNTWEKPGDRSKFGRLSTIDASNAGFTADQSNFIIGDASFIRLRNAALSYSFPQSWQRTLHLKNARIYVEGENLLTFTNYFGLDPENQSATSLPPLRTIVLGIHTSF